MLSLLLPHMALRIYFNDSGAIDVYSKPSSKIKTNFVASSVKERQRNTEEIV